MVGALFRPFFDPRRLLIGVILSYVPVLALLATGYAARMARAAHDRKDAPRWRSWPTLFGDGVLVAIVTAVYAAPFAIISSAGDGVSAPLIVRQIVLVLTFLAAPAALARMAARRNVLSAFAIPGLLRRILSVRYLAAWTIWAAIMLAAAIGIGSLPDWGVYLIPGGAFALLAVSASLFGWAVRER